MATTTQRQTAVALGAASWVIGDYRLWESTDPGVVLYARNRLTLATDAGGLPIATVTRYLAWEGETFSTVGGAATLTIAGAADAAPSRAIEDDWTRVLASSGYTGAAAGSPRYLPLPVQDSVLTAKIDGRHGTIVADPGSTMLRIDFTPSGITAWTDAVSGTQQVSGVVQQKYAYPQLMESRTAAALMHGAQSYAVVASVLDRAADGRLTGSGVTASEAWDELIRSGAIEITFDGGTDPDPVVREGLVGQVREHLFASLFSSQDAAVYSFRWTRPTDVPDFPLSISVGGWTLLTGSLECRMAELVSQLGPGAIRDVHETASVSVTVMVAPCDVVDTTVVSLDFGDVRPPVTMDFGPAGGSGTVTVPTVNPQDLTIRHLSRANFVAPDWPVVSVSGSATASDNEIRVDPGRWVRRHEVVLCVVEGGDIVMGALSNDDGVAASIRVEHPLMSTAISSSTPLDPVAPVVFSHPVLVEGGSGTCAIEVVGSIGGTLVRGSGRIPDDEYTVFVLVEAGRVRFVDSSTLALEPERLVQRLRARKGVVDVAEGARPESHRVRSVSATADVATVAQPTPVSGWAAALAMVVSARDGATVTPADAAARAGMNIRTAYSWPEIDRAVAIWELASGPCLTGGPVEWAALLRNVGPVWLLDTRAVHDGTVVAGVSGDGTPAGTWMRVIEPWPVRIGTARARTFESLREQFGGRAADRIVMVHR